MNQINALSPEDVSELVLAAMMDWFRAGGSSLSMDGSSFEMVNGNGYVLLRLDGIVQAVYRVQSVDLVPRRVVLLPEVHIKSKLTLH